MVTNSVQGVSTRRVDDVVAALGMEAGVSKSQVSRICAELDQALGQFAERRLDCAEFPSTAEVAGCRTSRPAGKGYFVVGGAAAVLVPASSHGVLRTVG